MRLPLILRNLPQLAVVSKVYGGACRARMKLFLDGVARFLTPLQVRPAQDSSTAERTEMCYGMIGRHKGKA